MTELNKNYIEQKTADPEKQSYQYRWVLLRGLGRDASHWGRFPQLLQNSLPKAKVITIDLPGTGQYSEMKSPTNITDITKFVRSKYLEIKRQCLDCGEGRPLESHLVAISLGGMIATEWLENWPEDFKSCTMINTSFRGVSPIYKRLQFSGLVRILRAALSRNVVDREAHIYSMVSNRPELRDQIAREWAHLSDLRPITADNFLRQLFAASRYSPGSHKPRCPTLILNSAEDHMVNSSCSRAIATKWGAPLVQHPTAGHDLPLDDPEWVVAQIRSFWLSRHPG